MDYYNCPKCGEHVDRKSIANQIRNVSRDYTECKNCGYKSDRECPPELTLSDWV